MPYTHAGERDKVKKRKDKKLRKIVDYSTWRMTLCSA